MAMLPQRVVALVLALVATTLLLGGLHLSLQPSQAGLGDAAAAVGLAGQRDWRTPLSALAQRAVFVPASALRGEGDAPPATAASQSQPPPLPPQTPTPPPPPPPPPSPPPAPAPAPVVAAGSSPVRDLALGNNNNYPSDDDPSVRRALPYSVTAFPPTSPTVSTFRWVSFGTPLWQGVVEAKGQTSDFTSVSFSGGRMTLYGLTEKQQAELQRWFEPFMHFDGTDQRYDKVEDVLGFVSRPLNWQSDCDAVEARYAFFVTPWMTMLFYHVVCEHLINAFANVRSANALPPPPFASPVLPSHHPRSVFTLPEPLRYPERTEFSPFEMPHLTNLSIPVLFLFTRWHRMQWSAATNLLNVLFPGGTRTFDELQTTKRVCFRRLRFGRGPPFHYFNKTFPFPLPPSHPLYSAPLRHSGDDAEPPADASWLAKHDISLYNEIELGKWAGAMIDFQHWMLHQHGLQPRVRVGRHRWTHMPLPGSLPTPPPQPRVLLMTRGRGAERGRFIANPQCLRDAMAALSPPIELQYFAEYGAPMSQQLLAYRDADVMVGLHGAAFTNVLYMAPGGLVVELQTTFHFDNNFFAPLAGHLDHSHVRVDVRRYLNDNQAGHVLDAAICSNVSQQIVLWWTKMHQDKEHRFRNVYT